MSHLIPDRDPDLEFSDRDPENGNPGTYLDRAWFFLGRRRPRPTKVDGILWIGSWDRMVVEFSHQDQPHDWVAEVTWDPDPYISRLEVTSRRSPSSGAQPGITSTNIRLLPISQEVFSFVAAGIARLDGEIPTEQDLERVQRSIGQARDATAQMEEVAQRYTAAVRRGDRGPNESVAQEMGYSRSTIARLVGKARKAGLLGPATTGKASL